MKLVLFIDDNVNDFSITRMEILVLDEDPNYCDRAKCTLRLFFLVDSTETSI